MLIARYVVNLIDEHYYYYYYCHICDFTVFFRINSEVCCEFVFAAAYFIYPLENMFPDLHGLRQPMKCCCLFCSDVLQCMIRVHRRFSTTSSSPTVWWRLMSHVALRSSFGIKFITCSAGWTFGHGELLTPFCCLSLVWPAITLGCQFCWALLHVSAGCSLKILIWLRFVFPRNHFMS